MAQWVREACCKSSGPEFNFWDLHTCIMAHVHHPKIKKCKKHKQTCCVYQEKTKESIFIVLTRGIHISRVWRLEVPGQSAAQGGSL